MRKYICLILIAVVLLSGCTAKEEEIKTVEIQTLYGVVKFPAETEQLLRHMEVTEGSITMEVFYMLIPDGEMEMFRIYYGDPLSGAKLGFLTVDGNEIPVTYVTSEYTREDMPDEGTWENYFLFMDGFNTVLSSIEKDSRFSATRAVEEAQDVTVELSYWTVVLPDNITCEETTENGGYRVNHYGKVGDVTVLLYSFQLGEPVLESVLGSYSVDGSAMPVSLATNDLILQGDWSEEERMVLYDLMDTINGVIDTIMSSPRFTEEISGEK